MEKEFDNNVLCPICGYNFKYEKIEVCPSCGVNLIGKIYKSYEGKIIYQGLMPFLFYNKISVDKLLK